jgi:hypothetical protein
MSRVAHLTEHLTTTTFHPDYALSESASHRIAWQHAHQFGLPCRPELAYLVSVFPANGRRAYPLPALHHEAEQRPRNSLPCCHASMLLPLYS